jgi:hypothetical protein
MRPLPKENRTLNNDAATTVKTLLGVAQLTVSEEEFDRFVGSYPTLRAQADALYRPDLRFEAPALAYDPLVDYS